MSHEINQLDIPDHQLQAGTSQSKGVWTEIGEAEITYTIFGNAKVRIIRKHDKTRRTLLLTATTAMVLAAMAWQVWFTSSQADPQQSADPAASALGASETESTPLPSETNRPATTLAGMPQQPALIAEQMPAKPARSFNAAKSQTAPHVAATVSPAQPVLNRSEPVGSGNKEGSLSPSLADVNQAAAPASTQP